MSDDQPAIPEAIENLLREERTFPPSAAFIASAMATDPGIYERAASEDGFRDFWTAEGNRLDWMEPWTELYTWDMPYAKWYLGGKLNVSVNCLDRHVANGLGDRVAYYWEGEPGDSRTITYRELLAEVCRFTNALRSLGVKKGDRVAIYMPMIPELPVAMLACTRIGAPHSVVFGGFSRRCAGGPDRRRVVQRRHHRRRRLSEGRRGGAEARRGRGDRPDDIGPALRGREAHRRRASTGTTARDHWYHDLVAEQPTTADPEPMDSEDLLYLLYTSGTTAKPKGIMHTTGGYLAGVSATHRYIFDLHPESDVYWCMADIGWVTGHSYIVYGPLANGTTSVIYEGAIDFPEQGPMGAGGGEVPRHDPLHRPDRDPSAHEVRRRCVRRRRPLVAAPARQRRRADQPRGVGVVLEGDRRRPVPGRRHVVADRDGDDHDHAPARHHDPQAGERHLPVPRREGRRRGRGRDIGPARARRLPRPRAPVAGHAARHLRRPGALRADLLVALSRPLLPGRRVQARRGGLLLAPRPRRRRHERLRATASRPPRSSRRSSRIPAVAEAAVVGRSRTRSPARRSSAT